MCYLVVSHVQIGYVDRVYPFTRTASIDSLSLIELWFCLKICYIVFVCLILFTIDIVRHYVLCYTLVLSLFYVRLSHELLSRCDED